MKLHYLFTILLFRHFSPEGNFNYPRVWRDENQVDMYHGTPISDPYRWLEDLESPETQKFVRLQNSLTEPYLEKCPDREKIKESLTELANYTKYTNFKRGGGKYFFMLNSGLANQGSLYYQETLNGEEILLLDPNDLSEDGTTTISTFYPSKDGLTIALKISEKGSDWFKFKFLDVKEKTIYSDVMDETKFTSFAWSADSRGGFYSKYLKNDTKLDSSLNLNQKLYYHLIGTNEADDILMAHFPNHPKWSCTGTVSHDGKYLLVFSEKTLGPVQVHFIELENFFKDPAPKPKLLPIIENFLSEYYYIANEDKKFYFLTNNNAPNWRVVGIDIYNPSTEFWEEIIQEDPKSVIDWVSVFNKNKLVLSSLQDLKTHFEVRQLGEGNKIMSNFSFEFGSSWKEGADQPDSDDFFFSFNTILSPQEIYRLYLPDDSKPNAFNIESFKKSEIPGFSPLDYVLTQVFYESKDGTSIPLFIAHKQDFELDGNSPCFLYGYGGFAITSLPSFSIDHTMFMKEFNGVYALANIRGGGEYGKSWYDGGRLFKKQNSFDDFEWAAKYLIANNYTNEKKLVINGNSNGGLLVAAAVNQNPNLYGAAIAEVGVMDVLRFNKFTAGASWVSDYGSPQNELQFNNILKYSPLHNVKLLPKNSENCTLQYPAMLLMTGDHDDRVVPSHSFKLISELQYKVGTSPCQKNPLMLLTQRNTGHGGGKPTSKLIEEYTNIYSFICKSLNISFKNGTSDLAS